MDKKVSEYIEKQPSPQKEVLQKLREIIWKTFPEIHEEMKMGVPWYEGKFYLVGLKDHVNIGFTVEGLPKKFTEQLEGAGKYMQHLKFKSISDIDEEKIIELLTATSKSYDDVHKVKNK